jgi:two-component system OmpR family response regulator
MNILLTSGHMDWTIAIAQTLQAAGHEVVIDTDLQPARLAELRGIDLLVAVHALDDADGVATARALRAAKTKAMVLVLLLPGGVEATTPEPLLTGDGSTLRGLLAELPTWVEALVGRRPRRKEPTSLRVGDLEMDLLGHNVRRYGTLIELTPREFKLLECLMRHAGKVVTRAMLLEHVWGKHDDNETSIVETEISRLRHKIDRDFERKLLHTVRGSGYRLGESGSRPARDR